MTQADALLERVRSQRKLPPPAERRRIRKRARVSLRELAAVLGCSHAGVRAWELGSMPGDEYRDRYAELLAELERAAA